MLADSPSGQLGPSPQKPAWAVRGSREQQAGRSSCHQADPQHPLLVLRGHTLVNPGLLTNERSELGLGGGKPVGLVNTAQHHIPPWPDCSCQQGTRRERENSILIPGQRLPAPLWGLWDIGPEKEPPPHSEEPPMQPSLGARSS